MQAVGLDKYPESRILYVVGREVAARFRNASGVYLYEPLTPQLQNVAEVEQQEEQ